METKEPQESAWKRGTFLSQAEAFLEKSKLLAFEIGIFAVSVSTLTRLLTHEMKLEVIAAYLDAGKLKTILLALLSILAVVVFLIHLFTVVLERKTRPTVALKGKVVKAFQFALDQSAFNPLTLSEQNDQSAR